MVRRLVGVLVIGAGVVAIILGTWFAFFLPQPQPRTDIRFEPFRPAYIVGEKVVVNLENRGDVSFCATNFAPWTVHRLVGTQWQRAEAHNVLSGPLEVEPGETWENRWFARNSEFWPEDGLAEVLPGEYRMRFVGWFCDAPSSFNRDGSALVELFAFFELV